MKYYLMGLILCVAATGCHKTTIDGGDQPDTKKFEPSKQYDVRFRTDGQKVIVAKYKDYQTQAVTDSVLTLTYNERVSLIIRSEDYAQSWGIIFNEDFKSSALDKLLYTTFNKDGVQVFNYLENNLNNITLQSKSDTVINGSSYTNLKLNRVIVFYKSFPDGKAAAERGITELVARKNDVVTHSAYFSYTDQTSVPTYATTPIVYTTP